MVRASAYTEGSLVMPPDREIVVPVSIRHPSGHPAGSLFLDSTTMENYGVLVSCTLVDTSNWSAEVLLINPGSNVVGPPPFSCVSRAVQVSAVAVARTLSTRPEATPPGPLPPHLE